MSVGLNFGSATSGTGFDVDTAVASIMALQRTPETAWATQTTTLQTQDTALTAIGSNISALGTALSSLTSFDGVLSQKQGASSDTGVVVLTSVGTAAQVGTHAIKVTSLATTAQQYSSSIATGATVSGTLTLQTSSSSSATSIQIASGSTLSSVASQINSSSAGVRASIVTSSSGSHLVLTSSQSGAAGDITVGGSMRSSDSSTVSFTESVPGADAQYALDGIALTSSSNAITGVLSGVTFQLTGVSASGGDGADVEIANDQSSIVSAFSTFVTAYNTLNTSLSAQEGKDSSGNAQPLYGSTVISEIQSRLASALNFTPSASYSTVSPTTPTASASGVASTTTLTLGATTHTVSGTLSLAVGSGAAHSITVASGTTLSALAAQVNGDSTYAAANITAAYDATTGTLTISGPSGDASTLATTGTSLHDTAPASTSSRITPASLGLTMAGDGSLSLDTGTLVTTLNGNLDGVSDAFQTAGNFGQNFVTALNLSSSTGNGTVALALKNNGDQETTLANNKTALEARLVTYESNLKTELTTANEILQQIPQQLSQIKQMFEAITGTSSS